MAKHLNKQKSDIETVSPEAVNYCEQILEPAIYLLDKTLLRCGGSEQCKGEFSSNLTDYDSFQAKLEIKLDECSIWNIKVGLRGQTLSKDMESMTCAQFRKMENNRFVGCNSNTENGYFWRRTKKIGAYGLWGLTHSNLEPECNSSSIGIVAQAGIWIDDEDKEMMEAREEYCRNDTKGIEKGCNKGGNPLTKRNGPKWDCAEPCGIYQVKCDSIVSYIQKSSEFLAH